MAGMKPYVAVTTTTPPSQFADEIMTNYATRAVLEKVFSSPSGMLMSSKKKASFKHLAVLNTAGLVELVTSQYDVANDIELYVFQITAKGKEWFA